MNLPDLVAIMPAAKAKAELFFPLISNAFLEFQINTALRQSAFLAQIAHESGQLRYIEELASGSAYEGREDLGNTEHGDGVKFKGRGLIQITGRANYAGCGIALRLDLIQSPEKLSEPVYAVRSAGWFWKLHGLNQLADIPDFTRITRRINGGVTGLAERQAFYEQAKHILGA